MVHPAAIGFGAALSGGAVILALALLAQAAPTGPGPAAAKTEAWPGPKWNEKLQQPYEEYIPIKDAITELARKAGVTSVTFTFDETTHTDTCLMVPLATGTTLKDAVQQAASFSGFVAGYENGNLVVKQGTSVGDWIAYIGGEPHPVQAGEAKGMIILPKNHKAAGLTPWVWYAPNSVGAYNAWMMKRFFEAGLAVVYVNVGESSGNPQGRAAFTAIYDKIVPEFKLAPKAVLLPQSRGGLHLYNWAAEHPDRVAAIGGIYPVCDLRSYPGLPKAAEQYGLTVADLEAQLARNNPIDRLAPLAKAHIPILHVQGDKDATVPLEKNSAELAKRYKALGGEVEVIVIPGKGHEGGAGGQPFFQNKELTAFLIKYALVSAGQKAPAAEKSGKQPGAK